MVARWAPSAAVRREACEVAELLIVRRVKRPAARRVAVAVGGLVGVKMETLGGRAGGGVVVPFVWGLGPSDASVDDMVFYC